MRIDKISFSQNSTSPWEQLQLRVEHHPALVTESNPLSWLIIPTQFTERENQLQPPSLSLLSSACLSHCPVCGNRKQRRIKLCAASDSEACAHMLAMWSVIMSFHFLLLYLLIASKQREKEKEGWNSNWKWTVGGYKQKLQLEAKRKDGKEGRLF